MSSFPLSPSSSPGLSYGGVRPMPRPITGQLPVVKEPQIGDMRYRPGLPTSPDHRGIGATPGWWRPQPIFGWPVAPAPTLPPQWGGGWSPLPWQPGPDYGWHLPVMPRPWPPSFGGCFPWYPMPMPMPWRDHIIMPCGTDASNGQSGAFACYGQPSAGFDPNAAGRELQVTAGSVNVGYRNPLGDSMTGTVKGPALEAGTAGFSASLGNVEGQFGTPIFGGQFTGSANAGLDASAHLWTGQAGQYGGEVLGIGGNVQFKKDETCVTIGGPLVEGTACLSQSAQQGIATATSDFMNDVSRGFDYVTSDPIGAAGTLANQVSDGISSMFK